MNPRTVARLQFSGLVPSATRPLRLARVVLISYKRQNHQTAWVAGFNMGSGLLPKLLCPGSGIQPCASAPWTRIFHFVAARRQLRRPAANKQAVYISIIFPSLELGLVARSMQNLPSQHGILALIIRRPAEDAARSNGRTITLHTSRLTS